MFKKFDNFVIFCIKNTCRFLFLKLNFFWNNYKSLLSSFKIFNKFFSFVTSLICSSCVFIDSKIPFFLKNWIHRHFDVILLVVRLYFYILIISHVASLVLVLLNLNFDSIFLFECFRISSTFYNFWSKPYYKLKNIFCRFFNFFFQIHVLIFKKIIFFLKKLNERFNPFARNTTTHASGRNSQEKRRSNSASNNASCNTPHFSVFTNRGIGNLDGSNRSRGSSPSSTQWNGTNSHPQPTYAQQQYEESKSDNSPWITSSQNYHNQNTASGDFGASGTDYNHADSNLNKAAAFGYAKSHIPKMARGDNTPKAHFGSLGSGVWAAHKASKEEQPTTGVKQTQENWGSDNSWKSYQQQHKEESPKAYTMRRHSPKNNTQGGMSGFLNSLNSFFKK